MPDTMFLTAHYTLKGRNDLEKLIKLLTEMHPDIDFNTETGLIKNHILNSFDIISIVMGIRDIYGIKIPGRCITPENFDSAESIFNMIKNGEKR